MFHTIDSTSLDDLWWRAGDNGEEFAKERRCAVETVETAGSDARFCAMAVGDTPG